MRPTKRCGFGHGVYEDSKTKKEIPGTFRLTQDNRGFRYVLNGATILAVGKLTSSPAEADANLLDENVAVVAPIGAINIPFTAAGATTLTEDELEGGMYCVNDATGEGQFRRISGNTAVTAGTAITITIDEPLKTATVAATTQHSIFLNPYSKVVICGTVDFFITGAPQAAIAANYYGFSQTKGWGVVWNGGTDAAGTELMPHTTDGQTITNDDFTEQAVGYQGPGVGVAGEYRPIFFTLE